MGLRIDVVVLGSGGVMPTRERYPPSVLVRDWNGNVIIIDAGEGAQYRVAEAGYSLHDIDYILITHDHGDHINGLAGLIQSMSVSKRVRPLTIMGPPPVIDFIVNALDVDRRPGFPVLYEELSGRGSFELAEHGGDLLVLEWAPACHTVESLAYRLEWRIRPRIVPEKLRELGLEPGPWLGEVIGKGEAGVEGKIVRLGDIAENPRALSLTYTGDTGPCEAIVELARDSTILLHEATYTAEMSAEARERGHSTSVDAATTALNANAANLVLFHISPRYRGFEARRIESEARRVFPDTILAWDLLTLIVSA